MVGEFDTKGSLTYFRNLILVFTVLGIIAGLFTWYLSGRVITTFETGAAGFGAGVIIYLIQRVRYGSVTYTISQTDIVTRRVDHVVRSVKIQDVDYYYFLKPETFPRLKLKAGKDFDFPMTLGAVNDIITALQAVGIKPKTKDEK